MMKKLFSLNLFILSTFSFHIVNAEPAPTKSAIQWQDYYVIKNIPVPKEINPQIGGLTVLKDGRIAAAFHAGEVAIYHPEKSTWQIIAKGLHEPLGLMEEASGALLIAQMPELTRLIDENGDGNIDFFQTVSDDFGMTGNYHEFTFGPARDSKGNYYISLNVASNYAGIFTHIRGEFNPIGLSRAVMTDFRNDEWKNVTRHKAGRMFSKAPYRGWIIKITPDGKTIPFASGFRSPNGLWVDAQDRLWVTDNQGDWLGTSTLYHVEEGKFYGHPASLVWKKDWHKNPVEMSAQELKKLKTPAAALFPHGELANSPTQPISTIAPEKFGLPTGELIIGDMNQARLIRYLPDQVNGTMQGTLIPFIETKALGIGNNRFSFDQQGSLWLGKTHLGWAGDEGIRKITWTKKPLFIAEQVKLTATGFALSFNHKVQANNLTLDNIKVTSHSYHYHGDYGSEKVDVKTVNVADFSFDKKQQVLSLGLADLTPERVYTIELKNIKSTSGQALMGDVLRYNLVNLSSG
ncbi:MAG: DUF7133 domain-containing protein [Thalassotalea sp.]